MNKVKFIHGLNAPREQFADNIAVNIRRKLPTLQTKRAMVVGGGPSAADHIEDIRSHQAKGWKLTAINGAHDWLLDQGIRPNSCVLMDSSEVVSSFVKRPQGCCTYYLASQCHPSMFDKLSDFDVVMWHAHLDDASNKAIEAFDPDATILAGANTAGLHAIAIEYMQGVRKLRVYGMDSSHRPSCDHAYDNSQQTPVNEVEFFFEEDRFLSTGTWAAQAEMFCRFWPRYFQLGMRIEVIGDGLLPAMARAVQKKFMDELINATSQTGNQNGLG
jgi:hypothetical protein